MVVGNGTLLGEGVCSNREGTGRSASSGGARNESSIRNS